MKMAFTLDFLVERQSRPSSDKDDRGSGGLCGLRGELPVLALCVFAVLLFHLPSFLGIHSA